MSKKYLKFPALSAKLGGRSRASIHRDMRDRGFPKPINLGANSVVWDEAQVDAWIEQLAAAEYVAVQVAPGAKRGRPRKNRAEV
ncbi:MAG: helix-turn-helix transcriptional regulator [Desulfobacter sp.]